MKNMVVIRKNDRLHIRYTLHHREPITMKPSICFCQLWKNYSRIHRSIQDGIVQGELGIALQNLLFKNLQIGIVCPGNHRFDDESITTDDTLLKGRGQAKNFSLAKK